ncbi:aldo-keto reductase superfamily protein Ecym_7160 [Eremothecium cymbalariae DBVPG|uniref:NADP-dependent oxidoreductase domain-containing protein n=1 Tax=Eremothecium cymbalariae (strain CBS 270.75 / DBVPG 7215 / KCTC 17166 / NRRL Y-17582) TaxID=931890 RepID=G8JVZ3_ERECY|nr:hypothetical protein Ecym_7160 [Eremothecium cymbalariae DBVPG\
MVPKTYTLTNGCLMPSLGLGCYSIPKNTTAQVVHQALKCGYRHFDTAVFYGNETEVGEGIAAWLAEDPSSNRRQDVFYVTKLWNSQNGYTEAKTAIQQCLQKVAPLGYIDLLLIHSPACGSAKRLATYEAMQESVDAGIVKSIGVSNYERHHLQELYAMPNLKHNPVVNQIEVTPWLPRNDLVDYCKSIGLAIQAYSPLGCGDRVNDPYIASLATQKNCTPAQILIAWSLAKGYAPLPKTQNIQRLQSNLDSYNVSLTAEELTNIEKAYAP